LHDVDVALPRHVPVNVGAAGTAVSVKFRLALPSI
jgi:hypothetical protein